MAKLFGHPRHDPASPARVPDGVRVYAIGDIHGRLDLLREVHALVAADAAGAAQCGNTVVYLGDYVDRGVDSRGVIDLLLDDPPAGFETVHLRGNHEDLMLRFLDDIDFGPVWLDNGGVATLLSYGVSLAGPQSREATLQIAQRHLAERLPGRHLAFLRDLRPCHEIGGYLFVHAGVRPGVALEAQAEDDLMWIREEFLGSNADHGRVVVHGHSIRREAELLPNRIGIDTGAYATGVLTCLVLEGAGRRLLQTAG